MKGRWSLAHENERTNGMMRAFIIYFVVSDSEKERSRIGEKKKKVSTYR